MYIWTDFDERGCPIAVNKNSVGYTPGTDRWAIGEYDASFYMTDAGDVVPRPAMGPFLAKISGGFRLAELPQPCKVTVNGQTWDVPDGTFEYATPLSGTHEVMVSAWPHLDWRTSVELEAKTETEESRTSSAANVGAKLGRLWRWMRGASRI